MVNVYLVFFFVIALFTGCKKFDKPEQAAAYLYIDKINLSVTSTQGSAAHDIIDAWVYVNDQPVGIFSLPALVPVLAEGKQKITIAAGIKNNGIGSTRDKYPFYEFFITNNVDLKPGVVDTLDGADQPTVVYSPASQIEIWNENFDDAGIDFAATSTSEAGLTHVPDSTIAFEGDGCAKLFLGSSFTFARVATTQTFALPKSGKNVYVEIHYKSNNTMAVGVQAINSSETTNIDNTVLRATNGEWKKMYVKLTEVVSLQSSATSFKFIITMSKDDGITEAENFIDNFKVVYAK